MANSTLLQFKHTGRGTNRDLLQAIENGQVRGPMVYRGCWTKRVAIGDFTAAAATSQELDLHDDVSNTWLFPADVYLLPGHSLYPITEFAGGGAGSCTGAVGDTDDTDGLVTASSIFTGATLEQPIVTPAAAQYALRHEAAFIPTLLLASDVNISLLTAGEVEVRIRFMKVLD